MKEAAAFAIREIWQARDGRLDFIPLNDPNLLDSLDLHPGKCDENATAWTRHCSGYRVVEGWTLERGGLFVPHYVVAPIGGVGDLVDVTFRRASTTQGIPFILHEHVSTEPLLSFARAELLG